jgi:NHL repeat
MNHGIFKVTWALSVLLLAACGGGGGSGSAPAPPTPPASPSSFSIGGFVSGLATGSSLTLTDNGVDALTVSSDGAFSFAIKLQSAAAYTVAVANAPTLQTCTVDAGTGTVAANVTSVSVTCTGPYSVGGTVTGLATATSLTLTNNGSDSLSVAADGTFTFATLLKPGSAYAVAIATQPAGEQCAISGATGTVSTASTTSVSVTCALPALQLLAGGLGGVGNQDGSGITARFNGPVDVAIDGAGNRFVADFYNATIRKIDTAGNVSTVAGKAGQQGTTDGAGAAARFNAPVSITVDPTGNLYVVDSGVDTVRAISPAGVVRTLAGTPLVLGFADGTGAAAQFYAPSAIRWSADGMLYLVDGDAIRQITTTGVVTTKYRGTRDFFGIDVSNPGFALLTDAAAKSLVKFDWATQAFTTLAGGFQRAFGVAQAPAGSAAAGTLYVSDNQASTVSALSPQGVLTTLAGYPGIQGWVDGTGANALFESPTLMTIANDGALTVADSGAGTIRHVTAAGVVTTIAGQAAQSGRHDGLGAEARFEIPKAVVADAAGNLYVGEATAIRKVTPAGVVTTVTKTQDARTLAIANDGTLYFTQALYNNSILSMSPDGMVKTFAGQAAIGHTDGTGDAATFNDPQGVAADAAGNVFVADTANAEIRKITPAGVVTTVAGLLGNPPGVDGNGSAAGFTHPVALAVDGNDTLFVADGNAIRRVAADGTVTTLAGSQAAGSQDGAAATARFNAPAGVAIGPAGSVVVSDSDNSTVRRISADGMVTTIAGVAGHSGVQPGSLPAGLNKPTGLYYSGATLYVVDTNENSVLSITGGK